MPKHISHPRRLEHRHHGPDVSTCADHARKLRGADVQHTIAIGGIRLFDLNGNHVGNARFIPE